MEAFLKGLYSIVRCGHRSRHRGIAKRTVEEEEVGNRSSMEGLLKGLFSRKR